MLTKSVRNRHAQIACTERWRVVVAEHLESHGHRYIPVLDRRGRRRCGRCRLLKARARTAADPEKAKAQAAADRQRAKDKAIQAEASTITAELLATEKRRQSATSAAARKTQ